MRRVLIAVTAALLAACGDQTAEPTAESAAGIDLLIRNARVVDGTGSPWFVNDVAISNGRIIAMAARLDISAEQVIDAGGRYLAPGFIDVHTHVESSSTRDGLEKMPRADNYLLDGVTTIVTGNCGASATDVAGFFRELDEIGVAVNVATTL